MILWLVCGLKVGWRWFGIGLFGGLGVGQLVVGLM
jgi:hypothetical protein